MHPTNTFSFSTCDFGDTFKTAPPQGGVRVLPPVFQNYGGSVAFCGEVVTVKCFEDNTPLKLAVQSSGQGRVLVVDGGASLRRALIGGNIAQTAADHGWTGVVIDGAARDAAELRAIPIGIRALALNPLPSHRQSPGQTGIPVVIQGVPVNPGDWLYADEDGILISSEALHVG